MGFFSSIFGKKMKVPEFKGVDIDDMIRRAIQGNIDVTDQAGVMTRGAWEQDQGLIETALARAIPGYKSMITGQRDIVSDFMSGRVPGDVADQISDRAAARGISTGTKGSQSVGFRELRNLGLTSLDMKSRGMSMAQSFIAQQVATMAKPQSVVSMFMSPAQRLAHATSERNEEWNRDAMAAKVAAGPSPVAAGLFNFGMQAVGMAMGAPPGMAPQVPGATPTGRDAYTAGSAPGPWASGMAPAAAPVYGPQNSSFYDTNILGRSKTDISGLGFSDTGNQLRLR